MSDELVDRIRGPLAAEYAIERELGRGGMATVYLAKDLRHERFVAIKVFHPELAAALGGERFVREIRMLARLRHPHLVPLYDSGEAGGLLYYVMPYVEGENLRARLEREKQLPVPDALSLAAEVAGALDYAHRQGIVHRDVKPENIMLEGGHAVVTDFGIARAVTAAAGDQITDSGITVGTPAYMSPEQAAGEAELDGRSDVYALGCVLYEMLAGRAPFTGATAQSVIAQRFAGPPPVVSRLRGSVPEEVDDVVACAMAPAPADRFQSAKELADALDALSTATRPSWPSARTPVRTMRVARNAVARRRNRAYVASALVGAALLAGVGAVYTWGPRGRGPAPDEVGSTVGPVVSTVAVLPFRNVSRDPDDEYFSDGMTEELINALANLPGLKVAARSSSFAFKGQNRDVREVARQLGVGHVVDGSVRRAGGRLRVTAQLINAADGANVWSHTYDEDPKDVFAVQDGITHAIAQALEVQLGAAGGDRTRGTASVEAYNLYQRGRYLWNRRTDDGFRRAIDYFQQAIAADTGYARAFAGLADCWLLLGIYTMRAPSEVLPKAEAAARHALALDPELAEAYTSLGRVRLHRRDFAGADSAFRRALALDPRYPTAHQWVAHYYMAVGRTDDALREAREAQRLDPLSLIAGTDLGVLLIYARRYDDAVAQYRRVLELDSTFLPAWAGQGRALTESGRAREAIPLLERSAAAGDPRSRPYLGRAYAMAGEREKALGIIRELDASARTRYVSPLEYAYIYTALGDREAALRWLARAEADGSAGLAYARVEPSLDVLRADPRFKALLRRLGLPQ